MCYEQRHLFLPLFIPLTPIGLLLHDQSPHIHVLYFFVCVRVLCRQPELLCVLDYLGYIICRSQFLIRLLTTIQLYNLSIPFSWVLEIEM